MPGNPPLTSSYLFIARTHCGETQVEVKISRGITGTKSHFQNCSIRIFAWGCCTSLVDLKQFLAFSPVRNIFVSCWISNVDVVERNLVRLGSGDISCTPRFKHPGV
jgi:hypothetical protein